MSVVNEAELRAKRREAMARYRQRNPNLNQYVSLRSSARSFLRNNANYDDTLELILLALQRQFQMGNQMDSQLAGQFQQFWQILQPYQGQQLDNNLIVRLSAQAQKIFDQAFIWRLLRGNLELVGEHLALTLAVDDGALTGQVLTFRLDGGLDAEV
ncbi:hypothetical protein FD09_GL002861 [Schleiferilactobacillus perolens DSM 12744]|uniref:Uncharacterized protein n=1 Tax=Schleiferilactobacillus perolens DSM 12744 TaxID=1423792 RepID=A0A0R1MWN5_9LACO|nr:hypothetical protein FD09_GL002861 [Schleiferilactobacillus perolens DSM 12744]